MCRLAEDVCVGRQLDMALGALFCRPRPGLLSICMYRALRMDSLIGWSQQPGDRGNGASERLSNLAKAPSQLGQA